GSGTGAFGDPVAVGGPLVVFAGRDDIAGNGPFATDGTPEHTYRFADLTLMTGEETSFLVSGSRLYFEGATDETGSELFAIPIAALMDMDHDGLEYDAEVALHTDPFDPDSDDDGLSDGAEVNTHGTNPLLADTDGDGFGDGVEAAAGTDPLDPG